MSYEAYKQRLALYGPSLKPESDAPRPRRCDRCVREECDTWPSGMMCLCVCHEPD